jgi:hypothetical protein
MTSPRVGLDRNLRLAWLDAAAAVAGRRLQGPELQAALMAALENELPGTGHNSARGKTVTVLKQVWCTVPEPTRDLRDRALSKLAEGDSDYRLALHWTMLLATYPFFADISEVIGRLLTLQGSFDRVHVLRRTSNRWGDRSTIPKAVRRILASMVEWGVLIVRDDQFSAATKRRVAPSDQAALLVEAALLASPGQSASVSALVASPMLFPFDVMAGAEQLRHSARFRVHREGLDIELLTLATLHQR